MNDATDAAPPLAAPPCSPVCPRCGRPRTNDGQPSRRWFYACGSYLYAGEKILRDRTDICEAVEALNDAATLLNDIMRDECNAQDEAEKWLRAYAPQYLSNNTLSDRASWITVMIIMPWTSVAFILAKLLGAY